MNFTNTESMEEQQGEKNSHSFFVSISEFTSETKIYSIWGSPRFHPGVRSIQYLHTVLPLVYIITNNINYHNDADNTQLYDVTR